MNDQHLVVSLRQPKKDPPQRVASPVQKKSSVSWKWYIATLAIAAFILVGGYWYKKTQNVESVPAPTVSDVSKQQVEKETGDLVAEVSKLIVLPEGETPTIATVSDPSKLKDQAFFANAKIGDKVLLYTKAKKAYLYDPVAKRLVEVAPITTDGQ